MNSLDSRAVLVTGAGSGLGAAIAARLVGAGARVALLDIGLDKADRVAGQIDPGGGRTFTLAADVGDPQAVDQAIAGHGRGNAPGLEESPNSAGQCAG